MAKLVYSLLKGIAKGQTEIIKSEDRQDHGQQNETKDKQRTHNTTLKYKAGVTRTLQNQGEFRCSGRVSNSFTTSGIRHVNSQRYNRTVMKGLMTLSSS